MSIFRGIIAASAVMAMASTAQAAEKYRIGGGPAGGGWHPAVSAGAQLLNSELGGKFKFNYSPSNGSVDNVRRVSLGDFHTAWGHVGQAFQSWNGIGLFKRDGASKDFRIVGNVRKQTQLVVVLADSPIKTFSDMKGKVVNLLNKGSGSNVNCNNIMKGAGIMDSIKVRNLGFSASARALGDRQIDVYCSAGAPFLIPAITMKSFAEEQRSGTLELLYTKPLTNFEIIFGKYLAGVGLVIFSLLPTLLYYWSVYNLGNPVGNLDTPGIIGSYIGLALLGCVFVAIGIFSSVVTGNQVVSFILAVFLCFIIYSGFSSLAAIDIWGSVSFVIERLGILYHYGSLSKGLIDLRDVVYFLSVITFMLLLTHLILGAKKW